MGRATQRGTSRLMEAARARYQSKRRFGDGGITRWCISSAPMAPVGLRRAIAIPESANTARPTALLDLLLQGPARPMQPDTDIVGGETEVDRDPLARLLLEIGPANDLGIVWPECWNDVPDAAAWIFKLDRSRLNHRFWSLRFVCGLGPLPRRPAPIIIGQRVAQDPTEPSVDLAGGLRLLRGSHHFEAEVLEGIFGILLTAQAPSEKAHEFRSALRQTLKGSSVGSDALGWDRIRA